MSEVQVKVSYKPLWRLLVEREMSKTDLRQRTGIAPSTFTKLNNNQHVALNVIARICKELDVGFDDVVEIVE